MQDKNIEKSEETISIKSSSSIIFYPKTTYVYL